MFFKRLAWYRRRVESLESQAVLDDLTGLRNQRALWRELTRRGSATSPESPLAVVMLDFDAFNEVNERYGHAIGDAVLRRAAGVLRESLPSPRLAFRYGGEEFVLLLPGDEEDARMLAEGIRMRVAELNGDLPAVTVSCGVADFNEPVEPWLALDRADAALRAAKRTGRNRVVVSGRPQPVGSSYLVEELEHETARRAALALAVATLEVRDRNTAEHSDDVLTLCESIGRRLGFEGGSLERLMAGAQLHDVGKVAMPSEILNKPGPLNPDEWSVIREHTVIGERILRSVPEMAEVATIVRHSHEHWDGSGYPDGLQGEQIPLASRIILCADAFHAIRSDRPYRQGRPADDAIAELRACAGTQLDPTVVDALVEVAADVRRNRGTAVAGLGRNRRLIALLATLAIGTSSAVAGIPELREAIKSLFAVTTAEPSDTFSYQPGSGFSFGPLGEALRLKPAAEERRASRDREGAKPSAGDRKRGRAGERSRNGGSFGTTGAPRGSGPSGLTGGAQPKSFVPGPGAGAPNPPAQVPATPTPTPTPTRSGTQGGEDVKVQAKGGNGKGLGLGYQLPTPRSPVTPPGKGGRTDPPAIGRNNGPAASAPGQAKGHKKP